MPKKYVLFGLALSSQLGPKAGISVEKKPRTYSNGCCAFFLLLCCCGVTVFLLPGGRFYGVEFDYARGLCIILCTGLCTGVCTESCNDP